jgi:hypothetical protein
MDIVLGISIWDEDDFNTRYPFGKEKFKKELL